MLDVASLNVSLGTQLILSEVSFAVEPGQTLGVLGANGCGKTSLLRAIAGDMVRSGSVSLFGRALQAIPEQERARRLGFLPQQSLLNFAFTVWDVVLMGRIPHSTGKKVDQAIAEQVMAELDITQLKDRLYPELSGGEKQRVQIARVLVQIWRSDNALLLLDEPMSALDWGHKQQLVRVLKKLSASGTTIVVVEHDLHLLVNFSDRLLALHHGQVVALGAPRQVVSSELMAQLFDADVAVKIEPQNIQLNHRPQALK